MARRSKKRAAEYAKEGGRVDLVRRMLAARPICEAGNRIGAHLGDVTERRLWLKRREYVVEQWFFCDGFSRDVHEILARSAGGSILDEANALCVCRACHDFIGRNPKDAMALGLRRSRYPGRNTSHERAHEAQGARDGEPAKD